MSDELKCMQVVRRVMDQTYSDIPGGASEKDASIQEAIDSMSARYRNGLLKRGGPDFSDSTVRFAYVHVYVAAHAHWIYEEIKESEELQALFEQPKLRLACLGGGPGSDLIGVLKYTDSLEDCPSIQCEIVDGCLNWKTTWADLAYSLDWSKPLHTDYVVHDVSDEGTWSAPSNIHKADLVVLSFFVSEICHLGDVARLYLVGMLRRTKPGCLVLFIDNDSSVFTNFFDGIAHEVGLIVLSVQSGRRAIYDTGEKKADLGPYTDKFGRHPKLQGQVASRILRRP